MMNWIQYIFSKFLLYPEVILTFGTVIFFCFCSIYFSSHAVNSTPETVKQFFVSRFALLILFLAFFFHILQMPKIWFVKKTESVTFFLSTIYTESIEPVAWLSISLILFCSIVMFAGLSGFRGTYRKSFFVIYSWECATLVLLSIAAMINLFRAEDLLHVFLLVELQSIIFFVLAASIKSSSLAIEGAIKYFIIGGFASVLLVFGIVLIYFATGTMSNDALLALQWYTSFMPANICWIYEIGTFCVFLSFLIKIGVAPFHMWMIDVYSATDKWIVMFFAILPKITLIYIFYFYYTYIFGISLHMQLFLSQINYFLALAVLTWLIAGFSAVGTKRVWPLIAFSTLFNVGFILAGALTGSDLAFYIYLLAYNIALLGLLLLILCLSYEFDLKDNSLTLGSLSILFKQSFSRASVFSLFVFSIAGMPPLVGFYSKFLIFLELLDLKNYVEFSILAVILSAIGILYYLRIIEAVFFVSKKTWFIARNASITSFWSWACVTFCFYLLMYCSIDIALIVNIIDLIVSKNNS